MTDVVPNEATVRVRSGPLVGAVLGRVVGMLAARAECPIDRLDDALLITDAVAAHAPPHALDGRVTVLVRAAEDGLELCVGPLRPDGAEQLLTDAALPGVGNVFEQVADTVEAADAPDGSGEQLVIRLGFARA
jgi:serine/threonine-protein kinase RsbW